MRYLIYLRVSTDEQRKRKAKDDKEEDGLGLQAQLTACTQWARKNSHGKILVYQDIITGTDKKEEVLNVDDLKKRKGLQEALSTLSKGDIFLVSTRDRLARDPFVMAMIERTIKKKQARFVCADGSNEDNSPNGVLLRHIIDGFSKHEALRISERIKIALAEKKARGERVGHIPYGYKLDASKTLVICPVESQILKLMYTYRVHNKLSFRAISDRLNAIGYRNRGGNVWTHGATSRVYINYERVCADDPAFLAPP